MEFHEKLQALRKQKGLTQEELAAELYVSRTAVSKWESGRGYPGIDSLKAISGFFAVSIDDLLSGGELLTIAQEDQKQVRSRMQDLIFGLLDCCAVLLLLLPLFAQASGDAVQAVGVFSLARPWLRGACLAVILGTAALGAGTLALQHWEQPFWVRYKTAASVGMSTLCVLLFLMSRQPYAACFSFVLLGIKALILLKKR